MHRSHQRHSYPFDKLIPRMMPSVKVTTVDGYSYYRGYNSRMRQAAKAMHNKKQRQYNKKLVKQYEREIETVL